MNSLLMRLSSVLQFGHDVSVVENNRPGKWIWMTRQASIWPRRQRRGEPPLPARA